MEETGSNTAEAPNVTEKDAQVVYYKTHKTTWPYPVTVGIIALLDAYLLFAFYIYGIVEERPLFFPLLGAHMLLYFVLVLLRRTAPPQARETSPTIFLLLPGVGSLLYGITFVLLYFLGYRYVQNKIHHAFKDENVQFKPAPSIDGIRVDRILDLSGVFSYTSTETKKEVIVDLLSGNIKANCDLLKAGLSDKDPEVVHYTASTLNYLEEQFEKRILEAKKAYQKTKALSDYKLAIQLYQSYIASGLLDEDIIPIYRNNMIAIMEEVRIRFHDDIENAAMLVSSYIDAHRLEEAAELLEKSLASHPGDGELWIMRMKLYYEKGEISRVADIRREIQNLHIRTPQKYEGLLSFWLEGIEG